MKLERTNRGFKLGTFFDLYGQECSIQESSLATKEAIWLGVDYDIPKQGQLRGNKVDGRMHIDKKLARQLIKKLQKFVDVGHL